MKKSLDELIQGAKTFALKEIKKFGFPTLLSFEISEKKALELTKKLSADKEITLLGVYLMDLKLGEARAQNKLNEHIKMSVKATREFLEKFDLEKEIKEKIINCVEAHHGEVPFICKEAEICANADCYRFLHPKGFLAAISGFVKIYGLEKGLKYTEMKIDEKYKILSLDICKKELEKYYFQFKRILKVARAYEE